MTSEQQLAEENAQMRKYRRQVAMAEADAAQIRSLLANLLTDWTGDDELAVLREKIEEQLRWNRHPRAPGMRDLDISRECATELNNGTVTVTLDDDWTHLCRVCGGDGPDGTDTKWLATYMRSESTNTHVYEVKQTK